MYQMEKNHNRCVIHHVSGGNGLLVPAVAGQGFPPSQWAAIGVLGSLLFGLLTYLTNLYFKIREDRRKAARGE